MIELAGVVMKTGEEIILEDPDPNTSARLFKTVSDRLLEEKPKDKHGWLPTESAIDPSEARDAINEVVKNIDEKLVISGVGKALDLGLSWYEPREPVIVSADTMDNIARAAIQTYNWDDRMDHRIIELDGERVAVAFTNGHTDYYRELSAILSNEIGTIKYSMQRQQRQQGSSTEMYLNFSHRDFMETGYEGHQLGHTTLSEEQEIELLKVLQRMGGVELDA